MTKLGNSYQRTLEQLDKVASKFWPPELSNLEADLSIIPLLLESQEQFISILSVDIPDLDRLFMVVNASVMPANLFVKHLVILADFGGEILKRVSREFNLLFPDGILHFYRNELRQLYKFRALPKMKFDNKSLHIEGKQLVKSHNLDDLTKDAIALLMFGSAYSGNDNEITSTLARCEIGKFIGKPQELSQFIKERYIWVSRITGGATANNLGQLAQRFVAHYFNVTTDSHKS